MLNLGKLYLEVGTLPYFPQKTLHFIKTSDRGHMQTFVHFLHIKSSTVPCFLILTCTFVPELTYKL